jgi:hypothetical protein
VAGSGWQWLAVTKGTAYNNAAFILHRKKVYWIVSWAMFKNEFPIATIDSILTK